MNRDKIAKWLYQRFAPKSCYCESTWREYIHDADQILSLIDGKRCICTFDDDECMLSTGCGKDLYYEGQFDVDYTPYCPCCGKRIEVKDGQG